MLDTGTRTREQTFHYDDMAVLIESMSLGLHPSQLHGQIMGALVGHAIDAFDIHTWFAELMTDAELELMDEQLQALNRLCWETQADLEDPEHGITLLLPSDDDAIVTRLQAVAGFAEGCLVGWGLSPSAQLEPSDEVEEILEDFSNISQIEILEAQDEELDGDELHERQEKDYTEIVEYMRVAVLHLHHFTQTSMQASKKNTDQDEDQDEEGMIR